MLSTRSPLAAVGRLASLLCLISAFVMVVSTGCAPTSRAKRGKTRTVTSKESPEERTMRQIDAHHLSYGVSWKDGDSTKQGTYKLSYTMIGREASVVESESGGFHTTPEPATPREKVAHERRAERVKSYLLMSPITAITGEPRKYKVGETYDGVILRPDGSPQFKYTCDAEEEIAGVKGYRLTIVGVREGRKEIEVVLSPDFQFPLYVKEHAGEEPLQIFLTEKN